MALDADNSGHFNKSEFHRALTTLGLYLHLSSILCHSLFLDLSYIM